jgi:phosphoribosylformylglycinamidine cyclo-ligase
MGEEKKKGMTYAEAGVDIDREEGMVKAVVSQLKSGEKGFGKLMDLSGHYTGLIDFGDVALSMCTDSIGTKGKIADALEKWDTVGFDCMAMNVNDMICIGATPIAFVDFFAIEKYDEHMAEEVGKGLAEAADVAGVAIIGGETASLPDIVSGFELAGTCLGYVKKDAIISGDSIAPGDVIIGIKSSGIHSNGLTLARKIVENNGLSFKDHFPGTDIPIGETLLIPTSIYVKEVLEVLKTSNVKGMAHITGGGLKNLPRLKKGVEFRITDPFKPQEVYVHLQKLGNVTDEEMYKTFNMGMGFSIVAEKGEVEGILKILGGKVEAKVVGEVVEGEGASLPKLGLKY